MDFVSASFIRILRYGALLLSLLLPGVYIALASFHQQMIPLPLLEAIIESKESVPFSTAVEVIALLLAFELLQEAGIHLPQSIGQSVSIIGGIVVGTAAVEASLISPAALIAVSLAGICGFALPSRDFAQAARLFRLGFAILGAFAGLFGVTAGFIALLIHLAGLTSLGVPYLMPFSGGSTAGLLRRPAGRETK
jgi:spore germination protein KA